MASREHTYTFRASGDLAERMEKAVDSWHSLSNHPDGDISAWVMREFERQLFRRETELQESGRNQSAFLRAVVESFVAAVEKVEGDLELAKDYAEWAKESDFDRSWAEAALLLGAERWREE